MDNQDTQTDTQTAVTNIHFASATSHAKCNNFNTRVRCVHESILANMSHFPRYVIMVALCNRADRYIFMLYLFFPRLISDVGDWMFTILRHMVWP